jgi:hypothetical protein
MLVTQDFSEFTNSFSPAVIDLNDGLARLRMIESRLSANQQVIERTYSKVRMGGLVAENSELARQLSTQLQVMTGICWSAITDECSAATRLDGAQWAEIRETPPDWLRTLFESATVLSSAPSGETLTQIRLTGQIVVVRDPSLAAGNGLLPRAAALMPPGVSAADVRIWWPWVMGADAPVVLIPTEHDFVLQETTVPTLEELAELAAA